MSIAELASLAEIVSAAGVIATLFFLAVELRKNTRATRQQGYHNIVSRRATLFYEGIFRDRETIEIFAKGLSQSSFDEYDSQRYLTAMVNILSHFQDVYMEYRAGIVEEGIWNAERRMLAGFCGQPGFTNLWRELNQYFVPEFIDEVAKIEPIRMVVYDPETNEWGRPDAVYLRKAVSGGNSHEK
jgi:hypothetical protein